MERISSVLSVAVSTGRIAWVLLNDKEPACWGMSRKAASTPKEASAFVKALVADFEPDLLISEEPGRASNKGAHVQSVLEAIARVFAKAEGLNVQLKRHHRFDNKFQEAQALVEVYPDMAHLLPRKPAIWIAEPRNISYFEALSFVEQIHAKLD